MTKEEAIKYLQQLYPNGGHCLLDEQRMEAIGMAVKALQEEPKPKFKKGDTIRYTDGDIRTVIEVREDCYKLDDFSILHFNAQDNWELVREPVSDDFEMALAEMIDKAQASVVEPLVVAAQWKDELIKLAKSEEPVSEEWIEELRTKLGSMSKEDFKKVFDKYAVDFNEETVSDDFDALDQLLAKYAIEFSYKGKTLKECSGRYKAEIIAAANHQEPVSEDLEKIVEEIAEPTILNAYGTKELARRLRATMCGTSVSEDLGEYINELSKQFPEVSFAKLSRIAVRVANWQKEQMMKDSIEGVITFDYYGDGDKIYGCIAHESFCLEDMGLKDRDKVKLIIIKED